ncbi:cation-translocating P-type ATPase [Maribacter halichondriae]|uniref:cation-translocating P-type ATPase n=1 Tax=Maribacter halichondriae TaxID=2980554 RepID=UPI0023598710|nr:cation-transporting P-type ATPase [Maribacter sp. Hal144]
MVQNPYSVQVSDILEQLNTSLFTGLTETLAKEHRQTFGENQVPEHEPKNRIHVLQDQLADPIIYILIAAALLAFLFRDWLEGTAIVIVILISVAIGFFMELQAIRSLEALRKMGQAMTSVIRSGKTMRIKASELVPGDIMLLEDGDVISADARLAEVDNLTVKESALTGESVSVTKQIGTLPTDTPITHRKNMVFKGTTVMTGFGKAIVTATGKNTELGHIQQMGIDAQKEATPLEKKLNQLSKWLIWLTLLLAVLIVISGYLRGKDLVIMIETGVALAVAAIPEGLPIVATIALARGMLRLSKMQVIIKKMEAVETLGATDIICTDKTGTLTEDKMEVHTMVFEGGLVTDIPHKNKDEFENSKKNGTFNTMLLACILCSNVKSTSVRMHGDSMEVALMHFAKLVGYNPESIRTEYPEILELPFDASRKLMATAHQSAEGFHVFVKGAFETVFVHCDTIIKDDKTVPFNNAEKWHRQVHKLASQGLRTLAFAHKITKREPTLDTLLSDLTFIGIIGCIDPARNDVKATIDIYKKAGIKVVMITGDHPGTSQKIAEEIGLLLPEAVKGMVLQGKNLKNIQEVDENLTEKLLNATVYARTTPEQKLDLIRFYQKNNHVVGMIGDGINDVPALRKADIGIAMGIRGTGAAREAADVILKNDKFTAIELAIHQGRVVFQNIRQFVVYLLSCNLAEILSVGIAALLNLPSPLLPLQILFLNLVTDTFPALALGLGKGPKDIMVQPPRNAKEPIMTRTDWKSTILYGICITTAVLGVVVYADVILKLDSVAINNMAFYTLVFAQLLNVFNMPKQTESFLKNEVTTNIWVWCALILSLAIAVGAYLITPVAKALALKTLSFEQWGLTALFALGALLLAQLLKRLYTLFIKD